MIATVFWAVQLAPATSHAVEPRGELPAKSAPRTKSSEVGEAGAFIDLGLLSWLWGPSWGLEYGRSGLFAVGHARRVFTMIPEFLCPWARTGYGFGTGVRYAPFASVPGLYGGAFAQYIHVEYRCTGPEVGDSDISVSDHAIGYAEIGYRFKTRPIGQASGAAGGGQWSVPGRLFMGPGLQGGYWLVDNDEGRHLGWYANLAYYFGVSF